MKQQGGIVPGQQEREPLRQGEKLLTPGAKSDNINDRQRIFLMTLRRAIIMILGALEDLLGIRRSVEKRKR